MSRRPPRVLIRTAAGADVGVGHISRCLSLADALTASGAVVFFAVRGDARANERVRSRGHQIAHSDDADATVVDLRDAEAGYFGDLVRRGRPVVAIDDEAARELPVSLVVNGTAGAERLHYRGDRDTQYLLGPRYALLRAEFAAVAVRDVAPVVRRALVTFGGSDPAGLTETATRWVIGALPGLKIDVLVGPFAEVDLSIARAHLHRDPPGGVRDLMLAADLALSAGGQTLYELAACGTPSIAVNVAPDQTRHLAALCDAGAVAVAGRATDGDLGARVHSLVRTLADPERRKAMSRAGRALVDGRGAERVAEAILALLPTAA